MTSQTLGRLWQRYRAVRRALDRMEENGVRREDLERQADALRDRLVVNYSPLVKYVSGRVLARTTGAVDQEDLISWGLVGLLDAIETYDPGRQAKFETYAISKIRWAMLDEYRKEDWVPRRVRARAQEIERAIAALTQDLRRPPSEKEVASKVGVSIEEYRRFLESYSRAQMSSLEARIETDGNVGAEFQTLVADVGAVDPQAAAEEGDLRVQLVSAMEQLEEQERLVATFYFYEGLTLREIGKALGLTEGRISQILQRALIKLREMLVGNPIAYGW